MALSVSDLPTVFSLLANSLSGDEALRKPAETALSQCQIRPGFCSCLMEIIASKDLNSHADVRLLATVYFKNSINCYWRHRRDSLGISSEEKTHLRNKLLLHLREENYQIAVQLAVLISKIARIDYPKEWPDLFSSLANQLQSADTIASHRVFMVLFRTLKELSTKRLTSDQKIFFEISSQFFEYCWHLWQRDVQAILHNVSALLQCFSINTSNEHHDDLHLTCERWLLCSKIIRQLITSGFPSDAKAVQEVRPVKEVCPALLNAIQSLLSYYSSYQGAENIFQKFIKKACTTLMKILVNTQGRHPYSFGDTNVLPPILDFCLNTITNPEPAVSTFDEFLIECMLMVKSILECKEYKPPSTGRVLNENTPFEQTRKNISNVVINTLTTLLPNDRVVFLCNILIRRYFVFSPSELDSWYQNPESFHHELDMMQWTEKLRPCAEVLYIVLFENYRLLLAPVVVSILHEAMNECRPLETEITPRMLLKDAAYSAVGMVYYELSNYLNFKEWFTVALSPELANDHPNMRIIHRKIAIILGQFVSEIKEDTRRPAYCALIRLLQDKDLAVRLAACRSMCYSIEDTHFSRQDFGDLLPTCWDLCFKLVEEVQEFDSKVQVLNLISVLIEHLNEQIVPYSTVLAEFFQKIWMEATGESLLQIQLLVAIQNLVNSLGSQSPGCYSMLLPILQKGIDVNSPDELNLLEDSLLLWEATLCHAPSITPQLMDFFPCLVAIMDESFEHLKVSIDIIEDYILLGGVDFLRMHASKIAKILDGIVGNVNDKGLISTLPIIELLIQLFPTEVPPLISNTLQKLIIIFLTGDDCDPHKTMVRAHTGAVLARLLVMNTSFLAHLSSESSIFLMLHAANVSTDQNILLSMVDVWLDKVDNVSGIQRKSYALALCFILTLNLPQVLDKLDQILSVCTSVILAGLDEFNEEISSYDHTSSTLSYHEDSTFGAVTCKEIRRRQVKSLDPIKQLSLENILKENLQKCASLQGESSFNASINKMDPAAFKQLQKVLKMS